MKNFSIFAVLFIFIGLALHAPFPARGQRQPQEKQQKNESGSNETRLRWNEGQLEEVGREDESQSEIFWLNSGAYFRVKNRVGATAQGSLAEDDKWCLKYEQSSPTDTDLGFHPQNLFRLIARSKWVDFVQKVYFYIAGNNLSSSENRNESNGVLLMSHYVDDSNLYYAGLRVDGRPVIKKKVSGVYYTLAYPAALYPGTYDRANLPSLLPDRKWMGLEMATTSLIDGSVEIKLLVDREADGNWETAAEANDDGSIGGPPHGEGYAGIRTDFMDVKFRAYRARSVAPTTGAAN
jgi:hypothetical protein